MTEVVVPKSICALKLQSHKVAPSPQGSKLLRVVPELRFPSVVSIQT